MSEYSGSDQCTHGAHEMRGHNAYGKYAELTASGQVELREFCYAETLRAATTNTHIALLECSVPPSAEVIAGGNREWCEQRLGDYLDAHPLPQYTRGLVVAVVSETLTEPGVGTYTVRRDMAPGFEYATNRYLVVDNTTNFPVGTSFDTRREAAQEANRLNAKAAA